MKKNNTYRTVGIVFMVAGLAAISLQQIALFSAWLPIGVAFFAIGSNDESGKATTKDDRKKKSKK